VAEHSSQVYDLVKELLVAQGLAYSLPDNRLCAILVNMITYHYSK
jgi:hypothetical protein